jgi:hypothetical protein
MKSSIQKEWRKYPHMQETCQNCGKVGKKGGMAVHIRQCGTTYSRDQFFAGLDKASSSIGCWLYTKHIHDDGYGWAASGVNCRPDRAHRVAWRYTHGAIPAGKYVLHHCDVRHCCNPDHLYLGDARQNAADKMARGRDRSRGTHNHWAKLTDDQVRQIRAEFVEISPRRTNMKELAVKFGIKQATIWNLIRGHTWKHLL